MSAFIGEPYPDTTQEAVQKSMQCALASVERDFGEEYSVCVGKETFKDPKNYLDVRDPACLERKIGRVFLAGQHHAELAMQCAERAHVWWRRSSSKERARLLYRTAACLRREKYTIAASMLYEASKSWDEAFGEGQEMIDAVMFYASEIESLERPIVHDRAYEGEYNRSISLGRGPLLAITPFNFPASFLAEKVGAGLAAGCPVLLKPAEQTPITAWRVRQCFIEGGFPEELISYLPGNGSFGDMLVRDPRVAHISFTGSRAAGIAIDTARAQTPGRYGIKSCDLELGGINSMIVCASGVSNETLDAIIKAKFGYNGQKCSALQFLIFVGHIAKEWKDRLHASIAAKPWGHPKDGFRYTALIDDDAHRRIMKRLVGLSYATPPLFPQIPQSSEGYFVSPAVFACDDDLWKSPLVQNEVFAPILFERDVQTIKEAVTLANATHDRLTGSIWSEHDPEITYAVDHLDVTNLYVHKPQTGAVFGRQPFGRDQKTGTGERLLRLMREETISSRLLRNGMYVGSTG